METQQTENIQWWPTNNVVENWWNMNVMPSEEYEALGTDMKARGPTGIDALRCCRLNLLKKDAPTPPDNQLVVLDGSHRLRWAKKYQWSQVKVVIDESVKDEADARAITYTKNSERGSIDPFKEAENYKWLTSHGQTQEQIAQRYNVDRTLVTHRLALLNIDPEVKAKLANNTRFTVSHIEPVASLPPEYQRKLATEMVKQGEVTVRDVEETVQKTKKDLERKRIFDEAVAKSKHKTCPYTDKSGKVCGKAPKLSYTQLPRVDCSSGDYRHEWNLSTGKTTEQERMEVARRSRSTVSVRKEKTYPQHIKSPRVTEEFLEAATAFIKKVYPQFTEIRSISVDGKIGKKDAGMNVDLYTTTIAGRSALSLEADLPDEDWELRIDANSSANKSFKSYIKASSYITSDKALKAVETEALKFLAKYGVWSDKKIAASAPKKRGRPPKAAAQSAASQRKGSSRKTTSTPASKAST
jgi:ParB/RepB/Spo0J family partition protein